MKRSTVGWFLCLLAGCGSGGSTNMDMDSGSNTPDSGATATPAMLTASGALDGGITADAPTSGYLADTDVGSFSLSHTAKSGEPFGVDIHYGFTGRPGVQAYADGSGGFSCNVKVTNGAASADTWVTLDNDPAGANKGTCSLSFSAVSVGSQGYVTHGSLSVTAPNMGGASTGTVTLNGTF